MKPGLLIVFEGLDGTGKTTQLARLERRLRARHAPVLPLREPGTTKLGEAVRSILLQGEEISATAETLLYMAARAELYEKIVLPALSAGQVVLLDRSQYSTAAYQGAGLQLPMDDILQLADKVVRGRWPDRVLLLHMDPAAALGRLPAGKDRIESRDPAYFGRVAQAFEQLARREPQRFRSVDAQGAPDEVEARVRAALADVLGD